MSNYLSVANSSIVFIICLVPIILVLGQSVVFIRLGIKRLNELNVDSGKVKKIATNSIISSIIPTLPIIISMAALMPSLGKYVPWLRLSVIGSAMYESMTADLALTSLGYSGLGDTSVTASAFVSVVFVMCVVSMAWPLCNAIGLKFYSKKLTGSENSGSGFMKVATGALMVGLMAIMGFARLFNFSNPISILVVVVAAAAALILDFAAKKTKIRTLADFSFPLAMVLGMATAVIANLI